MRVEYDVAERLSGLRAHCSWKQENERREEVENGVCEGGRFGRRSTRFLEASEYELGEAQKKEAGVPE